MPKAEKRKEKKALRVFCQTHGAVLQASKFAFHLDLLVRGIQFCAKHVLEQTVPEGYEDGDGKGEGVCLVAMYHTKRQEVQKRDLLPPSPSSFSVP